MNELGQLSNTGAAVLLRRSAAILAERGWVKGVTRDIKTGRVDVSGALFLASGVKVGKVNDQTESADVPQSNRAAFFIAWEALDWACDGDPLAWQDQHTLGELLSKIDQAATRLEIALV